MPMNLVIQEKRKELGLTQEQVAEYLNVSVPAVCKWEKGSTCPDISLLPSLARLLKIDLNTLLCFQEDLSRQEIISFCNEIMSIVRADGIIQANRISEGFERAKQKIQEYPHNETLLHYLTLQLDGLLTMSGLSPDEKSSYDNILLEWYRRLTESNDHKISNSANFMLAGKFIRMGDYDKAQETLDLMPDKEDIVNNMADKLMLQVIIYQQQGQAEKAAEELQNALLKAINKVQMLLYKLIDAELVSGETQIAKSIADKTEQMAGLFDLWDYNSFLAPLQIAAAEKNAGECICLLRKLLETMLTPWDMSNSPLFYRIAKTTSNPKQMLPAILTEMEKSPGYEFIRKSDKFSAEFSSLISEYKTLLKKNS